MINPMWMLKKRRFRRRIRCLLITLDGVGVGALPDASEFGDSGANTLAHVAEAAGGLRIPNLGALGMGNILRLQGQPPVPRPQALYGRLKERSRGKDTTVGHWELMGAVTTEPFPVYPEGFPPELIREFESLTGRGILGNRPASGTEIIKEFGDEHVRTGKLIVYTSADSVFQLAAHEDVVKVDELYEYCRLARKMLSGEHNVIRVIARPFNGADGNFTRTHRRRDFSVKPPRTYLNILSELKVPVHGVGKIYQIFAGSGLTYEHKTRNNADGLAKSIELLNEIEEGLIFTNLVDFDMLWGHRNDAPGFAKGLEEVDAAVPALIAACRKGDLLIITGDHGCDPATAGTDHTREYVPLLARTGDAVFSPGGALFETVPGGDNMFPATGRRLPRSLYEGDFSDVGATVVRFFTGDGLHLAEAALMPGRPFMEPG